MNTAKPLNSIDSKSLARIEEERRTVEVMIRLYCRAHHHQYLCPECKCIMDYAAMRLSRCPQAAHKPTCAKCTIHCYKSEMRGAIRAIMRYSGPRMIFHHPVMAIRHLLRELL